MSWARDPATGLVIPTSALPLQQQDQPFSPADIIKANMRQYLIDTVHDRVDHAEAVAAGPMRFREVFMKCLGAYFHGNRSQCDVLADTCYRFLAVTWREKYPELSAHEFLDKVHVPSPLSEADWQKEVDEAWALDIEGSDDALRRFYEGGARHRTGKDLGAKRRNVGTLES